MKFYRNYAEIIFHLAGWLLFLLFPFFFLEIDRLRLSLQFSPFERIGSILILILYFYLNMYVFVPKFLNKRKYILFLSSIVVFFLLIYFANNNFFALEFEFSSIIKKSLLPVLRSIFQFLFIFASSTLIRLFQIWQKDQKQRELIEKERIKSELSYLKLQISPHFLYNSLNSIYSLAIEQSNKTAEVVLKLSELTRYMTYTSEQKYLSMEEEIEHLTNFVDLQRLRLIDEVIVNFSHSVDDKNDKIEPMLLIPFVENAFKHGISYSNNAQIDVQLSVLSHKLHFTIKNKLFKNFPGSISKSDSGIGLPNVKRRLELLYPDHYHLEIIQSENEFKVELNVDLKG